MFRELTKTSGMLALLAFLIACSADLDKVNDDDDRNQMSEKAIQVPPEDYLAINGVLKRWREGYEIEDIETYMSAYWSQSFRYVSDMGTDGDKTNDLLFDDIREERDTPRKFVNF